MNFSSDNISEILNKHVCGFRQYILGNSAQLVFVSQNLCEMTGYSADELDYASVIHPADIDGYNLFLGKLCSEKKSGAIEYRIIKKDGSVIHVKDTVSLEKKESGVSVGYAVLSDISSIKSENDNLRFLNDTVPCGMLKYTCEKNPRVTYINKQMMDIFRFPEVKDGELDYFDLYKDNVYLMIPIEERRKFAHFLHQVDSKGTPTAGEISVLRCDGSRARLYGWVTKIRNSDGSEEFQSVCMDVTERYQASRASTTEQYLSALSEVYDRIFEYDFSNGTVKFVSGSSATFGGIRNLPMHMEEATEQWIASSVHPDDRERMRAFFKGMFASRMADSSSRPPQAKYRVEKEGNTLYYSGIFLKISSGISLFCCRKEKDNEADLLRSENISLKNRTESMQEMIMRYNDGVAAFEVTDDRVTPLYASDNVCEFFGFTEEEWLRLMKQSTSIREFVSQSAVGYERFSELLRNGEAEFTYYDIGSGSEQRIKAICSQKQADGSSPRYVMLYKMSALEKKDAADSARHKVYIRTFGYFDVFIDDKPIAFRNKKAKELLALLVDRRGGYVTSEQAIGYLWENEPANSVTQARYRKEALRLKNALEEYGIGHIMESVDGKRRIIPEMISCDLYDYLSGKEKSASLFKGSYLTDYAWGETTLGELANQNVD